MSLTAAPCRRRGAAQGKWRALHLAAQYGHADALAALLRAAPPAATAARTQALDPSPPPPTLARSITVARPTPARPAGDARQGLPVRPFLSLPPLSPPFHVPAS